MLATTGDVTYCRGHGLEFFYLKTKPKRTNTSLVVLATKAFSLRISRPRADFCCPGVCSRSLPDAPQGIAWSLVYSGGSALHMNVLLLLYFRSSLDPSDLTAAANWKDRLPSIGQEPTEGGGGEWGAPVAPRGVLGPGGCAGQS